MSAVWFIFLIGSLNACLGFAIALHLGRRYRASIPSDGDFDDSISWAENPAVDASMELAERADRGEAVMPSVPTGLGAASEQTSPTASNAAALLDGVPHIVDEPVDVDTGGKHAEAVPETERDMLHPSSGGISESPMDDAVISRQPKELGGGSLQDTTVLPEAAVGAPEGSPNARSSSSVSESDVSSLARDEEAGAAADPLEVVTLACPDANAADTLPRRPASPSTGDKTIEALLSEVEQYQEQLGQTDLELRARAEDPDSDSLRACLESLLEASREYAEQREQAQAGLDDIWGKTPEFGAVHGKLEEAFRQQDAQIESTERAVAAFPYVDDLKQGCRVMIGETTKLIDANLRVRDTLQEVGIELAREENRLTDLEPVRLRDALTGAESRESLEGALLQWMQDGDERLDTLSVAAIDIDEFGRVNEEFGHTVGNQLLHAFGKLIIAETGNRARLARFSGECFVLLFHDSDLRTTTNAVERLRQIVELACFEYKRSEIRITVSCGVAETVDDDTPNSVMARAEATLMEAKRYGRNRTFIHEGKYPTPVVPPKFPIEQRRMTL